MLRNFLYTIIVADQQNKIALFEKRIFVYDEISKVISVAKAISKNKKGPIKQAFDAFVIRLGYNLTVDAEHPGSTFANFAAIVQTTEYISQAAFLFPEISEDDTDNLSLAFINFFTQFIRKVLDSPELTMDKFTIDERSAFIRACEDFHKKYNASMMEHLNLTR